MLSGNLHIHILLQVAHKTRSSLNKMPTAVAIVPFQERYHALSNTTFFSTYCIVALIKDLCQVKTVLQLNSLRKNKYEILLLLSVNTIEIFNKLEPLIEKKVFLLSKETLNFLTYVQDGTQRRFLRFFTQLQILLKLRIFAILVILVVVKYRCSR